MFDCYELETQWQFTSLACKGSNPDGEWAREILKFDSTIRWGEKNYLYYTVHWNVTTFSLLWSV